NQDQSHRERATHAAWRVKPRHPTSPICHRIVTSSQRSESARLLFLHAPAERGNPLVDEPSPEQISAYAPQPPVSKAGQPPEPIAHILRGHLGRGAIAASTGELSADRGRLVQLRCDRAGVTLDLEGVRAKEGDELEAVCRHAATVPLAG